MKDFRKYFNKGLNADTDFELHDPGEWINAENVRIGSTDKGATGRIESIGGTDTIFDKLPLVGRNICIGGCVDDNRSRIIWFNCNSAGFHGIYCYDKNAGRTYTVMLDADVDGGLLFARNEYIHSCFYINNSIYWVNGTNTQPRRLNIESGIKAYDSTYTTDSIAYVLPIADTVISWIRKPPALPPNQTKIFQETPARENNLIKDTAVQFCYFYTYRDYEDSTLSPYSSIANYNEDGLGHLYSTTDFNRIDVLMPFTELIEQDVLSVSLVARFLPDDKYFVAKVWDKTVTEEAAEIEDHNSGAAQLSFSFFNDTLLNLLSDDYKVKLFDSIPIYVQTAGPARNRNFMANYIEGYDTPKSTSLSVSYNFLHYPPGVLTTVTGSWASVTSYVPPYPNTVAFQDVIATTTPLFGTETPGAYYFYVLPGTTAFPPVRPPVINSSDLTFIGNNEQEVRHWVFVDNGSPLGATIGGLGYNGATTTINVTTPPTNSIITKVFKPQGAYNLGVTFYDKYQRRCGIAAMKTGVVTYEPIEENIPADVTVIGPNTVTVNLLGFVFLPGDKLIVLTGDAVGNYTVVSETHGPPVISLSVLTVYETVFSSPTGSAQITILRPVIGEGSLNIPSGFIDYDYVPSLTWYLDNTNALVEIPEWAHYYSVDITKCLTTRFFFEAFGLTQYCGKDANGVYVYSNQPGNWSAYVAGVAIDTAQLIHLGFGYEYQKGDLCRIVNLGEEYTLTVIDTDGKYIILESFDIGNLGPTIRNLEYEIYTPYKRQDKNELYYEVGQMCRVTNPGTSGREYETLRGTIDGDCYLQKRVFGFLADMSMVTMSPNNKFWQNWNTDHGRPNAIDTIGQIEKNNSFCWSDVYIGKTKVNGLSSFSALNTENVPTENGAIRKLQLAQKVAETGTVMLSICENECCSIYLGETNILDNSGNAFLVKTVGLIGNIYALKGSLGTKNPESVFEYNGLVIYWDTRNGTAVQYADNGLFPISKNNFIRPANLFSKKFESLTAAEIEAFNSRPFIIGGVDPMHKEFLFAIPTTELTPPKGYLDYGDEKIAYPYDIYDGKGKTLIYKSERDMWMGSMSLEAEKFIRLGSDLYSFKDGVLYKHNGDKPANFYGKQHKAKIMYANNPVPGGVKTNIVIGLDSNIKPDFVHLRTENPYTQSSDLIKDLFTDKEGVKYAAIQRDRLSPNMDGNVYDKWLAGDRMFGKALLTMLEFDVSEEHLQLLFSHLGYELRKGHLIFKS